MCEPVTAALLGTTAATAGGTAVVAGTAATAATAATTAATWSKVGLAVQGISAGAQVLGAMDKSNRTNDAYVQNTRAAKDAYFLKSKQSNLRVMQEQTQASQQKQDADLKAMRAQGTAMAAAGGSGVQGANVSQLLNDFERSEGVLTDRISQRLEGIQSQNEMDKLGFQSEAINRISSMQPIGFAETLFNVVEPIAGFGIDYADSKARNASI
jgi:hypothetical protein